MAVIRKENLRTLFGKIILQEYFETSNNFLKISKRSLRWFRKTFVDLKMDADHFLWCNKYLIDKNV